MLTDGAPLGTAGGASNCITFPYQYPYYQSGFAPTSDFEVRRVKNGFIIKKSCDEFVFSNEKDLCAWIIQNYKKTT